MKQHADNEIFKTGPHLCIISFIKPFWAITLILYFLKAPEAFWFHGVSKGYKMGTLARNGLNEQIPNPCYLIIYDLI